MEHILIRTVVVLSLCLMFAKSVFAQAENIGIPRAEILDTMADAASKLGVDFDPKLDECGEFICNWSVGNAVRFYSMGVNEKAVSQLEAAWNNADKDTSIASADVYRSLCAIIIASAGPELTEEEIWQLADKIAIVQSVVPFTAQPEIRTPKQIFYGARYRPTTSDPNLSDEALLQCGVVANTSGEL